MNENTEKKQVSTKENPIPTGRGGYRPGAGRPKGTPRVPEGKKSITKSVNLYPEEWEALEQHAARIGARSVGVFAAQLLRQYIHQNAARLTPIEK